MVTQSIWLVNALLPNKSYRYSPRNHISNTVFYLKPVKYTGQGVIFPARFFFSISHGIATYFHIFAIINNILQFKSIYAIKYRR